jgi:hypothetical protein
MRAIVVAVVFVLALSGSVQAQEPPTIATCEAQTSAILAGLVPGFLHGYLGGWFP